MSRTKLFVFTTIIVGSGALLLNGCGGMPEDPTQEASEELDEGGEGKADTAAVKVDVDTTDKQTIKVQVTNGHEHPIFLGGCTPTILQKKESGKWHNAGVGKVCFWEGLAQKIEASATLDDALFPVDGTLRVKVPYKTKCADQKPFSQCQGATKNAYSKPFQLTKCSPVLCELYCPHGFATDANGCEVCSCKPAPQSDCRDTGCPNGKYCTFCWAKFACIPNGAVC